MDKDFETQQKRHRCIVMLLVIVAMLAVAAIVLPLVLDTCDCPKADRQIVREQTRKKIIQMLNVASTWLFLL